MIKAIANCKAETINLSLTGAGRLKVQSGKFKVFIDCNQDIVPNSVPEGVEIPLTGVKIVEIFKQLFPIISTDASRAWTNGIFISNQCCHVTNNVMIVQYWLGLNIPDMNIPREGIREIIRIGIEPISVVAGNNSVSFIYEGGKWIKIQLIEGSWPNINALLELQSHQYPIDPELFDALNFLLPFADELEKVYFFDGLITTSPNDENGARYELSSMRWQGVYNLKMLNLLKPLVQTIDWSGYPSKCLFYGENLRGAIMGLKSI